MEWQRVNMGDATCVPEAHRRVLALRSSELGERVPAEGLAISALFSTGAPEVSRTREGAQGCSLGELLQRAQRSHYSDEPLFHFELELDQLVIQR